MYIQPIQMTYSFKWINWFMGLCKTLINRIMLVMEKISSLLRKGVWILEAADVNAQIKDSVLFIGTAQERHYISKLFFNNYTHRFIGYHWLWQVLFPNRKRHKNCSFSVIQTGWKVDRFFRSKRIFCLPSWVFGSVEINSDFDKHIRKNKSAKNTLRKIENSHFKIETSSDPLSFEEFYYKMYYPYIYKRYGECAIDMSYNRLKSQFLDGGEILFVSKESQRIAGTMICYKKDKTVLYELGVRDGEFLWVKQGAISALYFNAITHCRSKGIKKLSLGGSRPFFSDGVLNYKLANWNMKIDDHSKTFYFLIKQHRQSNFAQEFLCNNPFISLRNGDMVVNTFFLKDDKENNVTRDMETKFIKNGLPKVDVHFF
jgi:hypothetical protein